MKRLLTALVVLAAPTQTAYAEDFSDVSRRMWERLQCSYLAGVAKDQKRENSLLLAAMRDGHEVLSAFVSDQANAERAYAVLPLEVVMRFDGPTIDFVMGRLSEYASSRVHADVIAPALEADPDNNFEKLAGDEFQHRKCYLL